MSRRITWLTAAATVAVLGGCGDGGTGSTTAPGVPDAGGEQPGAEEPDTSVGGAPGGARSALRPVGDRDTFFDELRGALVAQRGTDDDHFLVDEGAGTDADAFDAPVPDAPAPTEPTAAPGAQESADVAADSDASDGGARLEVTETNVQERGVDEQDRVKVSSDGSRLYVLQNGFGGAFPTEPVFVDDVESGDTFEIEPGALPIDGRPVDEPRFTTTLRVLGLDPVAADATPLRDIELDLGGRNADGMYLYESDAGSRVVLTSSGGGHWGHWDTSVAFGGLDSVVTRIEVDDPDGAEISGSFRIDGQIVSSRRIGKYLFFASRYYPTLPGVQPFEVSPDAWQAAVVAADDESLLPGYTDEASGTRTALVDPGSCFVAERPANGWYSPDIVTLAVVDLDTMALSDSECYLGSTETLYASPDAVYLATTRYDAGDVIIVDGPVSVDEPIDLPVIVPAPGEPPVATDPVDVPDTDVDPVSDPDPVDPATDEPGVGFVPREQVVETDIHQFDIDGGSLAYRGSGSVRGHLGFDLLRKPFRMSARDGFLRVATVNDTFGFSGEPLDVSPVTVSVLEPDGNGALARIAELPNADDPDPIGKPGERLYASRFVGDRAYLVTFRQTDPLYVVDLSDPRDPSVLGELEIEGYSDYLMPIGEDHLLGIGRDAVAAPGGGGERGGFVLGVKLSLFDVSDPSSPREADTLIVGQRGTQSEALFDHRGITVQHATDAHPTRISFGVDVAGEAFPSERPDPDSPIGLAYYDWSYTGLHGFDVSVGDGADIEPRGAMIVERRGQDGQLFGPSAYGDRSVMVNDATYYVHGDRVYAATWGTLANPGPAR